MTPSKVDVSLSAETPSMLPEAEPASLRLEPDEPFRILILGDFSGRSGAVARAVQVDVDNFDELLNRLAPSVNLALGIAGTSPVNLKFRQLSDFEPDSIFESCELLRNGIESGAPPAPAPQPKMSSRTEDTGDDVSRLVSGGLLDQIVEKHDQLDRIVERIVAPDLVPRESTDSLQISADRELRASVLARAILHHPQFQALESIWRWLDFLVRRLETGERLKLYIADVSKEELTTSLLKTRNFRSSSLYKIIIEDSIQVGERQPWAAIAGNYAFDRSNADDVEVLERIGLLARAAGAPFLAECIPSEDKESGSWDALRKSPHAAWIGLALPRILLRLPYGKDTCTVESFAFEEMPGEPKHQDYLWGNPAFACTYLLARAFCESGWDALPGTSYQIDDLPFHTFKMGGETRAQPPAEVLLSDNDCELLGQQGLMAFRAFKDRDLLRLAGFRSIAEPPTGLSGRWK